MNKNIDCNQKSPNNIYEVQCPTLYALNILGQKWKLPIIWYLAENDITRYNELKRRIKGITTTMLTKSLRELEEYNIIVRTQYNTIPPKVEYSLTERGKALIPVLSGLNAWGEEQIEIDKSK
ncbi:helix-turn-helix domain-containing protein [Clostridium sp. YIM B02555]|uniref:winged helix-turn-helix transcriptional regulator n=1 Tax=Clostridium sp. YIM B02555 TaxID=2911968 RepID=UPI001EEE34BA|nr:helix-turn-helix domain-containing protein [Clostridium sp. YIM B02555]